MPATYFDEWIAARYETLWPELFDPAVVEPAVSFLAELAATGPALGPPSRAEAEVTQPEAVGPFEPCFDPGGLDGEGVFRVPELQISREWIRRIARMDAPCLKVRVWPNCDLRNLLSRRTIATMATKTLIQLTDDLDPSLKATRTISFGVDGKFYEIDLSDKHSNELRSALDKYVGAARKVSRGKASTPSGSVSSRRSDLAQLRAWAASHGVQLNTRGRIANAVTAAYDAKNVAALRAATGQARPGSSRRRGRPRATSAR